MYCDKIWLLQSNIGNKCFWVHHFYLFIFISYSVFCRASSCPAWRPHTSSCSWGLGSPARSKVTPTLPSPSPSPFPTRAKMATSGALRISLQVLLPVITLLLSLLLTGSNASKYQDLLNFGAFNRFITHICKLIKKWSNHKKGGREGHYISFGEPFFFTLSTSKMLLLHFATAHLYLKIAC